MIPAVLQTLVALLLIIFFISLTYLIFDKLIFYLLISFKKNLSTQFDS
jgi:hypothetical protein